MTVTSADDGSATKVTLKISNVGNYLIMTALVQNLNGESPNHHGRIGTRW